MSFFSSGFSSIVQKRQAKRAAAAAKGKEKEESKKPDAKETETKQEVEEDKGTWIPMQDFYGRLYWQHSVTGQWAYDGNNFVSPGTVYPSPMYLPHQHQPFVPVSPVPSLASPAAAAKKEEKEAVKKGGHWVTRYDKDDIRYWEHTGTKEKTYTDPLF